MTLIAKLVKRWRLSPVTRRLPDALKARYGAGKFYTTEQVKSTADILRINQMLLMPAFAIACAAGEFLKANLRWTEQEYLETRTRIAGLLDIEERELHCETLTYRFRAPIEIPPDSGGFDVP